jgi:hypothetical protein
MNFNTSQRGTPMPYAPREESIPSFKPTAGEVFRTNQPLLAGGGLTRR